MPKRRVCYIDGACSGNPGAGGWAMVLVTGAKRKIRSGGKQETTNQQMELLAAIKALEFALKDAPLRIMSDSQYVVRGAEEWLPGWKRNGWRTSSGKEVANISLWKRLDQARSARSASTKFKWVRGHGDSEHNNLADQISRREAENRNRKFMSL